MAPQIERLVTFSCVRDFFLRQLLPQQASYFSNPGPGFETPETGIADGANRNAKVIAFYLPQFHSIPENDSWWGEGFTEWRNVTRGQPRFLGHYQPRLPRDLGFYDLRTSGVMNKQVELAKQAGIHGFCFYYYSFNGKRLLEEPLDKFVADSSIDFPFCLMWANENWTRRWDGLDDDVLIKQEYKPEDDDALVADLASYIKHPNYIRVDGKPLVCIYRPNLIPNTRETIARWRQKFKLNHGEEPHMVMAQGIGFSDPRDFGLDGAIEFPPNSPTCHDTKSIHAKLKGLAADFSGSVFKYSELVRKSKARTKPAFDLIRCVVPSWDNESRRQNRGVTYTGSTPQLYGWWLEEMISYARENPFHKEPLVFVNAWNEWAEGAYLEPDMHWGSAYLNATARAISGLPQRASHGLEIESGSARALVNASSSLLSTTKKRRSQKPKVLIVGHDAHLHGAQMICLNIARHLKQSFGVDVTVILLNGGPLDDTFREICPTHVIDADDEWNFRKQIAKLRKQGYNWSICNTVVTGKHADHLQRAGFTVVSLVHELSTFIKTQGYTEHCKALADSSQRVVFPGQTTRESFEGLIGSLGTRAVVMPQGSNASMEPIPEARDTVLQRLGLPGDSIIVLNAGFGDLRKGIDLYLHLARRICSQDKRFHFIWAGDLDRNIHDWLSHDLRSDALAKSFHHIPFTSDLPLYYQATDIFALTSREDPFPTVVVEALSAGVPVVAFDGGGGCVDMLASPQDGTLVPHLDVEAMARAVELTARDEGMVGANARSERAARAKQRFDSRRYAFNLLQLFDPTLKPISVIVPNYNYGTYLGQRLSSIFQQSYPIYELIVADDASTDKSLMELERIRKITRRDFSITANETNSGSVFQQWIKGVAQTRGEFVWIAEADDSCSEEFLQSLIRPLADSNVNLAFANSRQIDEKGRELAQSYDYYYRDVKGVDLLHDFTIDGRQFLEHCLSVKNVILNVSSVVFRRRVIEYALKDTAEELTQFRVAGDWRLYVEICKGTGTIAYVSQPLNIHRRHQTSVTHSLDNKKHLDEIAAMHRLVSDLVPASSVSMEQHSYKEQLKHQFEKHSVSEGAK